MSKWDKLLERVLSGAADDNIGFDDLCHLLRRLGFVERINGSHHIFRYAGVRRAVNLQPRRDGKAKDYQVAQARLALNIVLAKKEKRKNDA